MTEIKNLKLFLDKKVDEYNQPSFIKDDPISIPHRFTINQDIEIAGFFAAILGWGKRKSIIKSCRFLLMLMKNKPYMFIMNRAYDNPDNFIPFMKFAHRTFNASDLFHFLDFLRFHYWFMGEESLETAFTCDFFYKDKNAYLLPRDNVTIENSLTAFHNYVFGYTEEFEDRTKKHIATPAKKSACKRLNMYLRWMVRNDGKGVDFGIWENISASQLICPLDVHVARVARKIGLLNRKQNDWQAAAELTDALRKMDKNDPVKYDFALFNLGVVENY